MYQSAVPGPDNSVQYMRGTPTVTVYRGGSRSWRTHNPGEISHDLFALRHGAIGKYGRVAVFAKKADGERALRALLNSDEFAPLTVEQAYKRFDPSYEAEQPSDSTGAQGQPPPPKCPYTGIQADLRMNAISGGDREQMAQTITHELIGWREGTITEETLAAGGLNEAKRVQNKNVIINGRSAVHAGSKGMLTTPDVCDTPTGDGCKPVLYTNIARSEDADKTAATVKINGYEACTKASTFKQSTGDEPGSCGGIKSGTIQGKAEFITASGDVTIEGEPAVRQFDLMVSNNRNTPPMPLMQPGGSPPPNLEADQADDVDADERGNAPNTATPSSRASNAASVIYREEDES